MFVKNALSVLISLREGLANRGACERGAIGGDVPDSLQGGLESTLCEAGQVVRGSEEDVGVGEVEFGLAILLPAVVGEGGVAVLF